MQPPRGRLRPGRLERSTAPGVKARPVQRVGLDPGTARWLLHPPESPKPGLVLNKHGHDPSRLLLVAVLQESQGRVLRWGFWEGRGIIERSRETPGMTTAAEGGGQSYFSPVWPASWNSGFHSISRAIKSFVLPLSQIHKGSETESE